MPITAISADGVNHEFPDDTPGNVIDAAMQRYAVSQGTVTPMAGDIADHLATHGPVGRILDAFGKGARQNWGATSAVTPEDEKKLAASGLFNDYSKNEQNVFKSFNEAILRPLATALQPGALIGGLSEAAKQAGIETGLPKVGEFVAALPEILPGLIGVPFEIPAIARARDLKVIGKGEAGFQQVAPYPEPAPVPEHPEPALRTEPTTGEPALVWKPGKGYVANTSDFAAGEDIDKAIGDMSQGGRGLSKPITDGDLLDLADYLGAMPRRDGKTAQFTEEELQAAKVLVAQSAEKVKGLMDKVKTGEEPETQQLIKSSIIHRMLLDHIAGLETRGSEAELAELSKPKVEEAVAAPEGPTPQQQFAAVEAQAGKALDTPQLNKFLQKTKDITPTADGTAPPRAPPGMGMPGAPGLVPPGFWGKLPNWLDMIIEMRIMALISGPITHTTYILGNEALIWMRMLVEAPVAGIVGATARALGREGGARSIEMVGQIYGHFAGQKAAVIATGQALKSGQIVPPPGIVRPTAWIYPPVTPGRVGDLIRIPQHAMAGIHTYFDQIGATQWLYSEAVRDASAKGLSFGSTDFARHVADFVQNAPPEALARAADESMKQLLMGRGGPFLNSLSDLLNDDNVWVRRFARIAVPFMRISGNIVRQSLLERTPLGYLSKEIRDNIHGRNGAVAQDQQIARILTGTALGGATIWYASQGKITGPEPTDPTERATWKETGKQKDSIAIGNSWWELDRLGAPGRIIKMFAHGYYGAEGMNRGQRETWAGHAIASVAGTILDETWMRDISDIYKAVENPSGRDAQWIFNNFVLSFVPYSSLQRQMAQQIDPDAREAHTLGEQAIAQTPWWSKELHPKISRWGEEIPSRESGIPGTSVWRSRMNNDPVNLTLERLGTGPTPIPRQIRGVELNEDQYEEFAREAGKLTKWRLDQLIAMPDFDKIPPGIQIKMLQGVWASSRELVEGSMQMKYPDDLILAPLEQKAKFLETGKKERLKARETAR